MALRVQPKFRGRIVRKVVRREFVQTIGHSPGFGVFMNHLDCGHVLRLPASQSQYEQKVCPECEKALNPKPGTDNNRT